MLYCHHREYPHHYKKGGNTMPDTYCGKLCDECPQREALACPGCKSGPGGTCDLSRCCRQKGHENCSTCSFSQNCHLQLQKETMPQRRQAILRDKAAKAADLARRAAFFSKWLWPLFWLVIPSTIASIMTHDTITKYFPDLYLPGSVLQAVTTIAYGAILLQLSKEEDMYRLPGFFRMASGALGGIFAVFLGMSLSEALIVAIPTAIINLYGEYMELSAHSNILNNIDGKLSDHWMLLWKWTIGLYGATLGSVLLVRIIPILGLWVILAALVGLLVVGVLKLVYLYKTASVFSDYLRDSECGLGIQ